LGGALFDYDLPILDPTTDRPASAANKAFANLSAGSHTAIRAWADISFSQGAWGVAGFGQDALWGKTLLAAYPVVELFLPGVFILGWPVLVSDEIPQGFPGAGPQHAIGPSQLRGIWGRATGITTLLRVFPQPIGGSLFSVTVFDVNGVLTTPPTPAKISVFWL
jgi:hypothetical protein